MSAFGPVPSRRLGQSLGINNIPPKICSYSCIYCQLGRTIKMNVHRKEFYKRDKILEDIRIKIDKALGQFGIKTAMITNASILWRDDVREELQNADLVSVKIDSTREDVWRKITRPHPGLKLEHILNGILAFSRVYRGGI